MMERLIEMLKEPSSYGGIAILLGIVLPHAGIDAGTLQTIGAGVAALLAIVMKETAKPVSQLPPPPPLLDQSKTSCHAWLPLLLIGGLLLGGCADRASSVGTAPPAQIDTAKVAAVATDVNLVAGGFQRALVQLQATPNLDLPTDALNKTQAALTGIRGIAQALATTDSTAAAQPLIVQLEGYVNDFVGALALVPGLPPQVQAIAAASSILLPVIEVGVNLAAQPKPAQAVPLAAPAPAMTPDQARSALTPTS